MANGLPGAGWVDVASRAITTVGFPVVIAGILLWFVLGRFQDNMTTITLRMTANADAIQRLVTSEDATLAEQREQTHAMQQILDELKRRQPH